MLNQKQLLEIKRHLEIASNPLFFFDNDVDGLCSFLLLARMIGRGKGVAIKSFPELDKSYIRKVNELNPDYVFILDKPLVSKEFLDEVSRRNLPVVWVDHHDVDSNSNIIENVYYYNSARTDDKKAEPVTYICWKISNKKEDLWLAFSGCIGDNFLPDFSDDFKKEFPELLPSGISSAFSALYKSGIGKITRILNFSLKDRTSNVVKMIKFLLKVKSPIEILIEDNPLVYRFKQVNKKYQNLIEKAEQFVRKNRLVYFQYGGDLSLSSDIANELSYKHPDKIIVVAYIKGTKANISLRGKNVKEITSKAIQGLENATGGGHNDATGCKVNLTDLEKFKEKIEALVS